MILRKIASSLVTDTYGSLADIKSITTCITYNKEIPVTWYCHRYFQGIVLQSPDVIEALGIEGRNMRISWRSERIATGKAKEMKDSGGW